MVYTGNHLFHYTKFESALKIIATKTLKFGDFKNMNDIAEAKRQIYCNIDENVVEELLGRYKSLSMTLDDPMLRGYSIDPLWGHYAQKGNGICLVFNKERMEDSLEQQYGERVKIKPINYDSNHSNALFPKGNNYDEVKQYIDNNLESIFFAKSTDWKYEQELRILVQTDKVNECLSFEKDMDVLITAILCLPQINDYRNSPEYKILKTLLPDKPILHYTTSLGDKYLMDENGENACGVNWKLAL